MVLDKTTPCTLFEIKSPLWNGGVKSVGLNEDRIAKHNEIVFTYRRKSDGQLSFPDHYYFDGDKLKEVNYPRQQIKLTTLVIVPFSDLEKLQRETRRTDITIVTDPAGMPLKVKEVFFDNAGQKYTQEKLIHDEDF